MSIETFEREFKEKVSSRLRLGSEGIGRFRVFTPFLFEDGDHLVIVLKRESAGWTLSDEGHTYVHLTYDLEEKDLQKGTRQKIITNALSSFGVEDRGGELMMRIQDSGYGDALYSFVQALLRITPDENSKPIDTYSELGWEEVRARLPAPGAWRNETSAQPLALV
jgi:hypothetical protein